MWRRLKDRLPLRPDDWMVLISLLASLGMAVMATAGLWLWTIMSASPLPTASVSLPPLP